MSWRGDDNVSLLPSYFFLVSGTRADRYSWFIAAAAAVRRKFNMLRINDSQQHLRCITLTNNQ